MKNLQVNLNYNYGYRWYSNNNIKVKGYRKSKKMSDKTKNKIKNIIRKFLPSFLEDIIMKYKFPDINRTSTRSIPLLKEIDENIPVRLGNLIIAKWYISNVKLK